MLRAEAMAAWVGAIPVLADIPALSGIRAVRSVVRGLVQALLLAWGRISALIRVRASGRGRGSSAVAIVSAMDDSVSGIAALGAWVIHIMATMLGLIRTGGGTRIPRINPSIVAIIWITEAPN